MFNCEIPNQNFDFIQPVRKLKTEEKSLKLSLKAFLQKPPQGRE